MQTLARFATLGTFVMALSVAALPSSRLSAESRMEEFLADGDIRDVHDPTVIESQGFFYLYGTGGGSEPIRVLRSPDLLVWEALPGAGPGIPDWARERFSESLSNLWAPDVVRVGDLYHLYYSASRFGTNNSAIGLATTASLDPESPHFGWEDHGIVITSRPNESDFNAIDPNVVMDQDGRLWMLLGSYWSGLKAVELNVATGLLAEPDSQEIHSLATDPARPHAVEGAALLFHDGWYHLFFSKGACCQGVRSTYHIVVGRSRSITGPYEDRDGKSLMEGGGTLVLRGYYPVFGPGHNSVLRAGGKEWMVHHFYDARVHWVRDMWGKPTLQVRPIVWDAEGWPLPGESYSGGAEVSLENDSVATLVGEWLISSDFADWQQGEFRADGTVSTSRHEGTWSREGRVVELRWPDSEAPGGAWMDEVYLAHDGLGFVGRNQSGMIVRGRRWD